MDIWGLMKDKDEDVLSYMNKRYGKKFHDEFKIEDVEYGNFLQKNHYYYMSSQNMPLYTVEVNGHHGKYEDNYMPLYYITQYEEYMTKILTPEIGECKVISEISLDLSNVSPDIGFEEYLHSGEDLCCIVLASQKMDIQIYAEKICHLIKELDILHSFIMVRVLNDYSQIDNIKTYFDVKDFNTTQNPYYSDNTLCINTDFTLRKIEKGLF